MRCEQIMKRDVGCAVLQDTAQSAARYMRDHNIGFMPVCDDTKKVVGTVTDRDLAIRVLSDGHAPTTRISDVLTREVVACRPDDDLRKAEEIMATNHKSRIMCIDGTGRLVGVISLSDIAQREDAKRTHQTFKKISEREAHL